MYRLILSLIIFILLTGCSVFNNDKFQITDEQRFEKDITLVTATHITIVTDKLFVTAKAEQIPNI